MPSFDLGPERGLVEELDGIGFDPGFPRAPAVLDTSVKAVDLEPTPARDI